MTEAAQLAWMLIYIQTGFNYLKENFQTAYEESGIDRLDKQLSELEPIIQRLKDQKP